MEPANADWVAAGKVLLGASWYALGQERSEGVVDQALDR